MGNDQLGRLLARGERSVRFCAPPVAIAASEELFQKLCMCVASLIVSLAAILFT